MESRINFNAYPRKEKTQRSTHRYLSITKRFQRRIQRNFFSLNKNQIRSEGWKLHLKMFHTQVCGDIITYRICNVPRLIGRGTVDTFKGRLDRILIEPTKEAPRYEHLCPFYFLNLICIWTLKRLYIFLKCILFLLKYTIIKTVQVSTIWKSFEYRGIMYLRWRIWRIFVPLSITAPTTSGSITFVWELFTSRSPSQLSVIYYN